MARNFLKIDPWEICNLVDDDYENLTKLLSQYMTACISSQPLLSMQLRGLEKAYDLRTIFYYPGY